MRLLLLFIIVAQFAWNCKPERSKSEAIVDSVGQVNSQLAEASGLVASIANPGFLWTINDSGNPPEVYLIDHNARTSMVCKLSNAQNRDWEDIAIGAGPDAAKKYVYAADIGDNWSRFDLKFIYRFEEPVFSGQRELIVTRYDKLTLRMPDGNCDAETLLIDPITNDLFLISKRDDSVALYTTPFPFPQDTILLRKVNKLPFGEIVAGSVSRDGTQILLKNYLKVYYWNRSALESLPEVLLRKPVELPYNKELQGEAIAWSDKGDEYYTLSEGSGGNPGSLFLYKLNTLEISTSQ